MLCRPFGTEDDEEDVLDHKYGKRMPYDGDYRDGTLCFGDCAGYR